MCTIGRCDFEPLAQSVLSPKLKFHALQKWTNPEGCDVEIGTFTLIEVPKATNAQLDLYFAYPPMPAVRFKNTKLTVRPTGIGQVAMLKTALDAPQSVLWLEGNTLPNVSGAIRSGKEFEVLGVISLNDLNKILTLRNDVVTVGGEARAALFLGTISKSEGHTGVAFKEMPSVDPAVQGSQWRQLHSESLRIALESGKRSFDWKQWKKVVDPQETLHVCGDQFIRAGNACFHPIPEVNVTGRIVSVEERVGGRVEVEVITRGVVRRVEKFVDDVVTIFCLQNPAPLAKEYRMGELGNRFGDWINLDRQAKTDTASSAHRTTLLQNQGASVFQIGDRVRLIGRDVVHAGKHVSVPRQDTLQGGAIQIGDTLRITADGKHVVNQTSRGLPDDLLKLPRSDGLFRKGDALIVHERLGDDVEVIHEASGVATTGRKVASTDLGAHGAANTSESFKFTLNDEGFGRMGELLTLRGHGGSGYEFTNPPACFDQTNPARDADDPYCGKEQVVVLKQGIPGLAPFSSDAYTYVDVSASGRSTTATFFNPRHRLFRNGDAVKLVGSEVQHVRARTSVPREDTIFRNGGRVMLEGTRIKHVATLQSPYEHSCQRKDVVFHSGDTVCLIGRSVVHEASRVEVPRDDEDWGVGQKVALRNVDERPGAQVVMQNPVSFIFKNVAPIGNGEIVTLRGLDETPGEVIDLMEHGEPARAGTFTNARAFGRGEHLTVQGIDERAGEMIDFQKHCAPTELAGSFRNVEARLFRVGDAARVVKDEVVHMRTGARISRADGELQNGDKVDVEGFDVITPTGRRVTRTDARRAGKDRIESHMCTHVCNVCTRAIECVGMHCVRVQKRQRDPRSEDCNPPDGTP